MQQSNDIKNQLTLVIGGTGKTGRRVVERLQAKGVPVRVGSRSEPERPFDWEDESTWAPAIQDVKAAYITYYPDLAFPGAAEKVGKFAKLAADNGVKKMALLSGRGEDGALAGERAVQASGADVTVVRSSFFSQNFSEHFLLGPVLEGVIALPAGDTVEPFVDTDDIADIVAAALTEDGHAGQVYEVTGPRLLSFGDVAKELSAATGREIQYIPVSPDEYAAEAIKAGVPEDEAYGLVELFGEVLDGRNEHLTDGVKRALGREPRDFGDYARETAATGVWDV
jgi:uncharacterized protein YbjT (DUF2867 family)